MTNPETPATSPRAKSSSLLALLRLTAIIVMTSFTFLAYAIQRLFTRDRKNRVALAATGTRRWAIRCARIAGFTIRVEGTSPPSGVLLAPNHMGYSDIIAISAALPCLFAPKGDIAAWPVLGSLVRSTEQVFISRAVRKDLLRSATEIADRLKSGTTVCVFLEGTSSGGTGLLPFKSALIQPAIDAAVPIVPVGIRWSSPDPAIDPAEDVAYWKDHVFGPHLWRLLGLRHLDARIIFGESIPTEAAERSVLGLEAHRQVAILIGIESSNR